MIMMKKFTIRLDEELSQLFSNIRNKNCYNLSALARKVLKERLSAFISIDNSSEQGVLQKGTNNNENIKI